MKNKIYLLLVVFLILFFFFIFRSEDNLVLVDEMHLLNNSTISKIKALQNLFYKEKGVLIKIYIKNGKNADELLRIKRSLSWREVAVIVVFDGFEGIVYIMLSRDLEKLYPESKVLNQLSNLLISKLEKLNSNCNISKEGFNKFKRAFNKIFYDFLVKFTSTLRIIYPQERLDSKKIILKNSIILLFIFFVINYIIFKIFSPVCPRCGAKMEKEFNDETYYYKCIRCGFSYERKGKTRYS